MNGRAGLVLISLLLCTITAGLYWRFSIRFRLSIKLALAILFIWTFIWISPQFYYFYYRMIFDGLPLQNVIQTPPMPLEILKTITFTGQSNLSNHSKGLLFWILVTIALNSGNHKTG
jgi:hypothetical protein